MSKFKTVTVKRKDLDQYLRIFGDKSLLSLPGMKFSYFIEKNFSLLDREIKEQQKVNSKEMEIRGELSQEYRDKEEEILQAFCTKDQSGKPIVKNGAFNIPNEKMEEFEKTRIEALTATKKLKAENEKVERYNKIMDDYMDSEVTIDFRFIYEDELPDQITGSQRILIKEFIVE